MRIEEEIKLDYTDVLFRPKRSTLSSRKDVDLRVREDEQRQKELKETARETNK